MHPTNGIAHTPTSWNFADVWEAVAARRPHTPALVHGTHRTSWAAFDAAAAALAAGLRTLGLLPGDAVALCTRNRPEYLIALFACFKSSLIPAGCNFRYTANELVELWMQLEPRAVVYDATTLAAVNGALASTPSVIAAIDVDHHDAPTQHTKRLRWNDVLTKSEPLTPPDHPRTGDDTLVMFTGGTTGTPKGVVWRQDDLFVLLNRTAQRPYDEHGGLDAVRSRLAERGPAPRLVVGPPLIHGLGSLTAMNALCAGGTVATLTGGSFSAHEFLDAATEIDATQVVIAGDAFAQPVLDLVHADPTKWPLQSLRVVLSSGTRWSTRTRQALLEAFPKVRCVDVLGATEAIGVAASVAVAGSTPATERRFELGGHTAIIDDNGRPLQRGTPGQGRLATRGRSPLGYLGDADLSQRTFLDIDGERWTVLGDVASLDIDGVITLIGRGSSVINTGGEKVFPDEVEEALRRDPAIVDAVVLGVDDEILGETVVAIVQPVEAIALDVPAVMAGLRTRLAGYKHPRRIVAVDVVPRDAAGKVDRVSLRRFASTPDGTTGEIPALSQARQ